MMENTPVYDDDAISQNKQSYVSNADICRFNLYFKSNMSRKGNISGGIEDVNTGKINVDAVTSYANVTYNDVINHLSGQKSLGLSPLLENNMCKWACLDVDTYKSKTLTTKIARMIYDNNLHIVPFYSKGKGLHLITFFEKEIKPEQAVKLVRAYKLILGLPSKTEVFPKQMTCKPDGYPSWLNLPLFDAYRLGDSNDKLYGARKLINSYGEPVVLQQAWDIIGAHCMTIEEHETALKTLPFSDGPPCLQSLYLQRSSIDQNRNKTLFAFGVYYKGKSESWRDDLLTLNSEFMSPLDNEEVENTVIKSLATKTYNYRCNDDPLSNYCEQSVCRKREYGRGGHKIMDLDFEDIHVYYTDPPRYELHVNGKTIDFYKESEFLDQTSFGNLCYRYLGYYPCKVKNAIWCDIINNIERVEHKDDDLTDGSMAQGDMLKQYTHDFFNTTLKCANLSQIELGRIYIDPNLEQYIFKQKDYLTYIRDIKKFKSFNDTELDRRLQKMGGTVVRDPDNGLAYWHMPMHVIPESMNIESIVAEVNFLENRSETGEDVL